MNAREKKALPPIPRVAVIILNWNSPRETILCLESVFQSDYPDYSVFLVDNGSCDGSVQMIQGRFPDICMVENKNNLGYTGGNNIAILRALDQGFSYAWLLNNDTSFGPRLLSHLVRSAEACQGVALISPVICYHGSDRVQFCSRYVDWEKKKMISTQEIDQIKEWERRSGGEICPWGTALLVKRVVFKEIGILDDRFFAYWEDTDFAVRANQKGLKSLIVGDAKIYHHAPEHTQNIIHRKPHYYYFMNRNKFIFWKKHLTSRQFYGYFFQFISETLVQYGLCRDYGHNDCAQACIDGAWAGILGITGPWDTRVKLPRVLKKVLTRHPYFIAKLLGFHLPGC